VNSNHSQDKQTVMSEWVDLYTNDLYNWAYYKTSNTELSQDLVQDAFLAAWNNIEGFQGNSKPLTWLKSILNNKIVDYYRKNGKIIFESINHNLSNENDVTMVFFTPDGSWSDDNHPAWENEEHLLDNSGFKKIFDACIESLPESAKFAVLSKYILEKKAEEICQELNISPTNYWQLIHRAKLKLKKCLDANWNNQ
jgi:RNA polymerase sigma-70 factor (TIGR02943 family)